MVYDVIIFVLSMVMVYNTVGVARDLFNQRHNARLIAISTLLYVVVLLVSLFGLHPRTYLNLVKSVYQVLKTSLIGAYDSNDVVVYSAIANIILVTIISIILKTLSLTNTVYMVLGVLTIGLVVTRTVWSLNMCNTRYTTPHDARVTHSVAVDKILDTVGNSDTTFIYRILKTILSIDIDSKVDVISKSVTSAKLAKPVFNSFKKKIFNAH